VPERIAKSARHECRPGWRALRFDVEVEQVHAFTCKRVDARRRRTTQYAAA
jgi:hypothetical protein